MGPALPMSAQLEAFRRTWPVTGPVGILWVSATLRTNWLATVDFREHVDALDVARIEADDRERAGGRIGAVKRLRRAPVALDRDGAKKKARGYVSALTHLVLEEHRLGEQTLIILNRVDRP